MNPDLGRAGSVYAKTVRSGLKMPADRPDPGLLFDCEYISQSDLLFLFVWKVSPREARLEILT